MRPSKSIVELQYGTGTLVTSSPRPTEAFCHVIYYTNHVTKLQATSLGKDFEIRSKDRLCVLKVLSLSLKLRFMFTLNHQVTSEGGINSLKFS